MMSAEAERMRWRCRRGLLELDIVLGHFVARHYASLSPEALQCFNTLLDYPDSELWELIVGKQHSKRAEEQALLATLRTCAVAEGA
jgi:antitoxin CptB